MENNKNKKSVKFQGDTLNFCDFIQVFVFTPNHHLRFTDRPDMTLDVYRGRETTTQQQGLIFHVKKIACLIFSEKKKKTMKNYLS